MSYLEWTNIFSGVRVRPVTYTLVLKIINGDIKIVLSRTITTEWVSVAVDLEFTRGTQRGYSSKPLNTALLNVF